MYIYQAKIKLNRILKPYLILEYHYIIVIKMSSVQIDPIEMIAENILYELWFSVAETIFNRVCEVTELDEEQREALKQVALRPNDFQIVIEE